MLFSLDAVHAREGDCLILHYGPKNDPSWILIDGGARGVYKRWLRKRFAQIRETYGFDDDTPFPLRMLMVSHIDADHISGVLDLADELDKAKDRQQPLAYDIRTLWHNSFDDILGNKGEELLSKIADTVDPNAHIDNPVPLPAMSEDTKAVVASTKQGRLLRRVARKLGIKSNDPFEGLVMTAEQGRRDIELGHGLTFTVLGPRRDQVIKYQKQWDKDLPKILADEKKAAEAASFSDESPFNLASIVVLATLNDKTMLLTGDARGDHVITAMVEAGLLEDQDDTLHVDLLKLPHHGSDRNATQGFFEQITADHYVVSADGKHHNPDVATLDFLADARGDDDYHLHLTFEEEAFRNASSSRAPALRAVHDWLTTKKPDNCEVHYRDTEGGAHSIVVDLEEDLPGL